MYYIDGVYFWRKKEQKADAKSSATMQINCPTSINLKAWKSNTKSNKKKKKQQEI